MNINFNSVIKYLSLHGSEVFNQLMYTLGLLVFLPVLIAFIIGLPLAILIAKNKKLKWILQIANFLGSIPSMIMFLFMIVIGVGIGFKPSLITLTIYALVPIMTYTVPTMQSIDNTKAIALNMNKWQSIWYIDIPMSSPQIVCGIKMALIYSIANSILCANIGCKGLGKYVMLGMSQMRFDFSVIGTVPLLILVIIVEYFGTKLSSKLAEKIKNEI